MRLFAVAALVSLVGCIDLSMLRAFDCDGGVCGAVATGGGEATGGGVATGGGGATGGGVATGGGDATGGGIATGGGAGASCTGVSCGAHASCVENGASYTCVCDSGYEGTPTIAAPASCDDTNECLFTNCGTNTSCANIPGSWQCGCAAGYVGATVTGGTTTCTAATYCLSSTPCGANATCVELMGGYACRCDDGFTGATTTGAPATCVEVPPFTVLGSVSVAGASWSVGLSAAVDAGATLVAVASAGGAAVFNPPSVSDSRGNVWYLIDQDASFGRGVAIYTAQLTNPLQAGDSVSSALSFASAGALWVARVDRHVNRATSSTYTGAASTQLALSTSVPPGEELLAVGAFVSNASVAYAASPPGFGDFAFTHSDMSGLVQARVVPPSTAPVTLSATASPSTSPRGVIATFSSAAPVAPTNFALVHSANNRSFTTSWTMGRGNGGAAGCQLQFFRTGTWVTVGTANCDANRSPTATSLPSSISAWSTMGVRVRRVSDNAVLHTFSSPLTCTPVSGATTPTPSIDEDCDGVWDDKSCVNYAWTADVVVTSCPTAAGTNALACDATTDGNLRFTASSAQTPAVAYSTSTTTSTCVDGGANSAQRWTCVGSGCSWF